MALTPLNAGVDPRFQQPNPPAPPDLPAGGTPAKEPALSGAAASPASTEPAPGQPELQPPAVADPLAGMRAELARRVAATPPPEAGRRFREIGGETLRMLQQGAIQPPGGEMVPPEGWEDRHVPGGLGRTVRQPYSSMQRRRVISIRPYHLAPSRELPGPEREEAGRLGLAGTALPGPGAPGRTVWVPIFEGEENDPDLSRRLRTRALILSRQQHPWAGAAAMGMAGVRGWALNLPALSERWRRAEEEFSLLGGVPREARTKAEVAGMLFSGPAGLLGRGLLRAGNLLASPLEKLAVQVGGSTVAEAFGPVLRRLFSVTGRFGSRELGLSTWELSRAAEMLDRAGARVVGGKGGMKVILPPEADQVLVDRAIDLLRSVAKRQGGKLGLRIVRQTAGRRIGELALKAGASGVRHATVAGGFTGAYAAPELAGRTLSGEITPGQALGAEASAIARGAALFGPLAAAGRLGGELLAGRPVPQGPVPELAARAGERPLLEAGEAAATPPPAPPVEPVPRATPGVLQTPIPEVRPLTRAEGPPAPAPEPQGVRDPQMAASPLWASARLDTARRHAREAVDATGDPRPIEVAEKVAEDLEFLRPALGTMSDAELAAANTGAVAVIEEASRLAGSAEGVRRVDRLLGIDTDAFFREPGLRGPGVVEVAGRAAVVRWADELVQAANRHDVQLPDPPAMQDGSLPGLLAPALELAGRLDEAGVPVPPLVARDPRTGRVRVYRWEDVQALGADLPQFLRGEDRPNEFTALRERVKAKTRARLEDLGPREVVATFTSGAEAKPVRTVLTREEARAIEADGEGPAPEPVRGDINIPLGKELAVPSARDWETRPWEAAKQQKVAASRAFAGFDEEQPIAIGVARTPSGDRLAVVQWAGEPWFQDRSGRITPVRYHDLAGPGWSFTPVPGLPVRWELTDRGELRLAEVDPRAAAEFEQARREMMGVEPDILSRAAEAVERLESPRELTKGEVQALRDTISELEEELPEAPPGPDVVERDGSDAAAVLRQADGYEKAGGWLAARQFVRQAKKVLNARAKAEDATEPTIATPVWQQQAMEVGDDDSTWPIWKWVQDSVLVHPDGSPIIFYHGTADPTFLQYEKERLGEVTGAYSARMAVWAATDPVTSRSFTELALNKLAWAAEKALPAEPHFSRTAARDDFKVFFKYQKQIIVRRAYVGESEEARRRRLEMWKTAVEELRRRWPQLVEKTFTGSVPSSFPLEWATLPSGSVLRKSLHTFFHKPSYRNPLRFGEESRDPLGEVSDGLIWWALRIKADLKRGYRSSPPTEVRTSQGIAAYVSTISGLGFLAMVSGPDKVRRAMKEVLASSGTWGAEARRLLESMPKLRWLVDKNAPLPPRIPLPWNLEEGEVPTPLQMMKAQQRYLAEYVEPATWTLLTKLDASPGNRAPLLGVLHAALEKAAKPIVKNQLLDADPMKRGLAALLAWPGFQHDLYEGPFVFIVEMGFLNHPDPRVREAWLYMTTRRAAFTWAVPTGLLFHTIFGASHATFTSSNIGNIARMALTNKGLGFAPLEPLEKRAIQVLVEEGIFRLPERQAFDPATLDELYSEEVLDFPPGYDDTEAAEADQWIDSMWRWWCAYGLGGREFVQRLLGSGALTHLARAYDFAASLDTGFPLHRLETFGTIALMDGPGRYTARDIPPEVQSLPEFEALKAAARRIEEGDKESAAIDHAAMLMADLGQAIVRRLGWTGGQVVRLYYTLLDAAFTNLADKEFLEKYGVYLDAVLEGYDTLLYHVLLSPIAHVAMAMPRVALMDRTLYENELEIPYNASHAPYVLGMRLIGRLLFRLPKFLDADLDDPVPEGFVEAARDLFTSLPREWFREPPLDMSGEQPDPDDYFVKLVHARGLIQLNLIRRNAVRLRNPLIVPAKGKPWNLVGMGENVDRAIKGGHDGAIFTDLVDLGPPNDIVAVLDPENIRIIDAHNEDELYPPQPNEWREQPMEAGEPQEEVRGEINISNVLHDQTAGRYQSHPVGVAIREAVQNALGAVRRRHGGTGGRIRLAVDPANLALTVEDDGDGMSPETIRKHFLSLANVKIQEKEGTVGGFGIGAKAIFVFSEVQVWTNDGSTVTELEVDPHEYRQTMKARMTTRPARPDDPMGTRITMRFPSMLFDMERDRETDILRWKYPPEARLPGYIDGAPPNDAELAGKQMHDFLESLPGPALNRFLRPTMEWALTLQSYAELGLLDQAVRFEFEIPDAWKGLVMGDDPRASIQNLSIGTIAPEGSRLAELAERWWWYCSPDERRAELVTSLVEALGSGHLLSTPLQQLVMGLNSGPSRAMSFFPLPVLKKALKSLGLPVPGWLDNEGATRPLVGNDAYDFWRGEGVDASDIGLVPLPEIAGAIEGSLKKSNVQVWGIGQKSTGAILPSHSRMIIAHISIRGLPQFTMPVISLLGNQTVQIVNQLGSALFIDIDPEVPERDAEYPFLPSREDLKANYQSSVQNIIREKIDSFVQDAARRLSIKYVEESYGELPPTSVHAGGKPQKFHLFRTTDVFDKDPGGKLVVKGIREGKFFTSILSVLARLRVDVESLLGKHGLPAKEELGLGSIPLPGQVGFGLQRFTYSVNPFLGWELTDKPNVLGYSRSVPLDWLEEGERVKVLREILGEGFPVEEMNASRALRGYVLNPITILRHAGFDRHDVVKLQRWAEGELSPEEDEVVTSYLRVHVERIVDTFFEVAVHEIAHGGGAFDHTAPEWQWAVQQLTRYAAPMLARLGKELIDTLMADRQALVEAVRVTKTAWALYEKEKNTFGHIPIKGMSSEESGQEQAGRTGAAPAADDLPELRGAPGGGRHLPGPDADRRGIPVSPNDALAGEAGGPGRGEALPDGSGQLAARAPREGSDVGRDRRPSLAARPAGRIWRKLRWFRLPVWREDLPELLADRKPSAPGARYVGEDPFAWPGHLAYVYSLGLSLRLSHPPGGGGFLLAWEDEADAVDALAVNGHGYVHEVRVFPGNPLVLEVSAEGDDIVNVPGTLRGFVTARYGGDLARFVRDLREGLHPTKPPSRPVVEFLRWLWDDSGSTFDAVHIVVPGRPAVTVVKDSSTVLPLAVAGKKLTAVEVQELADLRNLRMVDYWAALQAGSEWANRWDVPVKTRLYLQLDADHWRQPAVPVLRGGRQRNVEQKEVFLGEGNWVDVRGVQSLYLDARATEARLVRLLDLGAIPRRVWSRLDSEKVHERNLTIRQVLRQVPRMAESLGLDPADALPDGVVLRATLHGNEPAVVVFDRSRLRDLGEFAPGAWRQMAMTAAGGPAPWKMPWPLWKALHPDASKREHLLAIAEALEKGLPVPTSVLQSYDGMYEMVMEKDPRLLALDLARRGEGLPEWAFEILSDAERAAWIVRRIGQLSMPGGRYRQVRKAHLLRALRKLGLPMADGSRIFPFGWEPPLDLLPQIDEALIAALKRHKLLVSATQKLRTELDAMRGIARRRGEGRKLSLEEAAEIVAQWSRDPSKLSELHPDLLYAVARHFHFLDTVDDPYTVLPPVTMAHQDDQGRPNEKARELMDRVLRNYSKLREAALDEAETADMRVIRENIEAVNPTLRKGKRLGPVKWTKLIIADLLAETRTLLLTMENLSAHTKRMEAVIGPELQAPTPRLLYERIAEGELERNPWALHRAALMGRLVWLKQILAEVDDIFEAVERIPRLDHLLWRMLNGDLTPEQAVASGLDRHYYTVRPGPLSPVKKTVEVSLVELYRRFRKVTDRIKEQWLEARASIYEETRVAPALMTTWALEYERDMLQREISMFEQALEAEKEGSPAGLLAACGFDLDSVVYELENEEEESIFRKARRKARRIIKARKKRLETVERDLEAMRELLEEKRATRTQIAEPEGADIKEYAPHQEALTASRARELAKDTSSTAFSDLREPPPVGFVHGKRREEKVERVLPSFLLTFSNYLRRAANYIWLAPIQVRGERLARQLPSPQRELYNMWVQRTLGIPDLAERHLDNGFKDWFGQKPTNLDRFIRGLVAIDPAQDLRLGPSAPTRHTLFVSALRAVGTLVDPIAGTALNLTQVFFSGVRMSTSLSSMLAAPFFLAGAAVLEAGTFLDVGLRKFLALFAGKGVLKRDIRREALISSYEQFMEFYGAREKTKKLSPTMPIKRAYEGLARIALFGLYLTDLYFKGVTFRAFRWWAAMDGVPDEVIDIGGLKLNARDYTALYHTERVYPNYSPAGRPPVLSTLPGRAWAVLRTFPLALRDWLITDRAGARFSRAEVRESVYLSRLDAWERFLAGLGRKTFLTRPFRATRPEWGHGEVYAGPGPREPETRLPWEKGARLARVRQLIDALVRAGETGDVDVPPMESPDVAFRRWLGRNATEEEREAARAMLQTIPPHGELGVPSPEAISAFRFRWLAKYPWMFAGIMFLAKMVHMGNWLQLVVPTAIGGQSAILAALDYFYRWVALRSGRALMGGHAEPWMERAEKEAWANMISQVYGGRVLADELMRSDDPQALLEKARERFSRTMNRFEVEGPPGD